MVWDRKIDRKYPVLSDPGAQVITRYGLLHAKGHFSEDIAIRTAIYIDGNGIEQWRRVSTTVPDTPGPDEVLEMITQH